ncbi:MAG: hypothetical protein QW717_05295 [Candidatus Bathyarchaeia archaeon]
MKDKIKRIVLDVLNLDFFGVAPVDRFEHAPKNHHPEYLLPGAKSVVSMGTRILESVRMANVRFHYENFPRHLLYSYLWYGYNLLNWFVLDHAAYIVAKELEKSGYVALPIASSGSEYAVYQEGKKIFGQFSNRHAAVAAGLGEFGLSRLVLNPITGPRVRWVSVITTAELDFDALYNGPKLCRADICAKICEEKFGVKEPLCHHVCPVNAFISQKMEKVVIGEKTFYYPDLDMVKCMWAGSGHIGKLPLHVKTVEDVRKEPVDPIVQHEMRLTQRANYCGKCLTMCPSPTFASL